MSVRKLDSGGISVEPMPTLPGAVPTSQPRPASANTTYATSPCSL